MTDPLLSLQQVSCHYDSKPIVEALSFQLKQGEIGCLLGPSGCGKTTTLRAIAGFEPIGQGKIQFEGQLIASAAHQHPPEQRPIGFVFQDYALFPHLTVKENIQFGLKHGQKHQHLSKAEKRERLLYVIQLTALEALIDRYPHELSGGQQQRVALARALATKPRLVLLDEPFSNLDTELRRTLGHEVKQLLNKEGITGILVTHDQEEAFAFADQVGVIRQGKLIQWDTPYNLYHEPKDRFIANFIGRGKFLKGRMLDGHRVETELGTLIGNRAYPFDQGQQVDVLLRPDDIVHDEFSSYSAKIIDKTFIGASTLYRLELATKDVVESLLPSHINLQIGVLINIRLNADHLILFPSQA